MLFLGGIVPSPRGDKDSQSGFGLVLQPEIPCDSLKHSGSHTPAIRESSKRDKRLILVIYGKK